MEKQAGERGKPVPGFAVAQQDRVAQAKAGNAEQFIEVGQQDVGLHTAPANGATGRSSTCPNGVRRSGLLMVWSKRHADWSMPPSLVA